MKQSIGVLLIAVFSFRIAFEDIRTHFIRDLDLLILFSSLAITSSLYVKSAFINCFIYLLIYFLSRRKLGVGDIKLAFVIGLTMVSISQLAFALNAAWVMGGLWAIFSKRREIAFAPWMLIGGLLAQIMVI